MFSWFDYLFVMSDSYLVVWESETVCLIIYIYIYIYICVCVCVYIYIYIKHFSSWNFNWIPFFYVTVNGRWWTCNGREMYYTASQEESFISCQLQTQSYRSSVWQSGFYNTRHTSNSKWCLLHLVAIRVLADVRAHGLFHMIDNAVLADVIVNGVYCIW